MQFKEFEKKLKKLNPKLVIIPGPGHAWGVYAHEPQCEDANELGLHHICGMPRPSFFCLPRKSFWRFHEWKVKYGLDMGKPEFNRGWETVLQLLVDKGYLPRHRTRHTFGVSTL